MNDDTAGLASAIGDARRAERALLTWLNDSAYPLWATNGRDAGNGGFQERLDMAGRPLAEPRRARVQPRQIYAFAQAPALGWQGDAAGIVQRGLDFYLGHYRRPGGFFRTLVAPDGIALDETVFLYDQAFALLAFATIQAAFGKRAELEAEGSALRTAIEQHLGRANGGFDSGLPGRLPLLSNPHMHLFEACLAWLDLGADPAWQVLADALGNLAMAKFIDHETGALRETFAEDWSPAPGLPGRIVEPGHQFEWSWLLLRWAGPDRPAIKNAAFRLIEIGERHGVRDGFAIDALVDDFTLHEPTARLWPQTERLKAASLAATLTGQAHHWRAAAAAADALITYFETPIPGLWRDRRATDGSFAEGPAPASSFYHIVAAIMVLTEAVSAAG